MRFVPNDPQNVLVDAKGEVGVVSPHIDEVYIHRLSLNQFRAPFGYPDLDKPGDCERMIAMLENHYIPLLRAVDDMRAFRAYVSSALVMNREFQRTP